jgi:hypothetical protein
MSIKRLVRKDEANSDEISGIVVNEYFSGDVPSLGLAVASIEDSYPPRGKGYWAMNALVEEMYYVLEGTGTAVFGDGTKYRLVEDAAVYFPCGMKYRIEDAKGLRVVVTTGPAWTRDQHTWSD